MEDDDKIVIQDKARNCSEEDVVDILVAGAKDDDIKKLVVLFSNTKEKRVFSDTVGKMLKNSPAFTIDRSKSLVVQNNLLQSNNTKVFLGLRMDEELLTGDYTTEQIKYYAKRID